MASPETEDDGDGDVFVKENATAREFACQSFCFEREVPCPRPLSFDAERGVLRMERVGGGAGGAMSLSDFYGEEASGVPVEVLERCREILLALAEIGVCYPDITGYNFMQVGSELLIVDFGHATRHASMEEALDHDRFFRAFAEGRQQGWNPEFR